VRVNDYAELTLGSLVMLANTNGTVPLSIFSTLPLSGLQAELTFSSSYFSSVSFDQPGVQSTSATFEQDGDTAALTFTANGGGTLVGQNPLGVLRLTSRPLTNSTAVRLRVTSLDVTPAASGAPTLLATNTQVVVVGSRTLLDAHLAQGVRELTVFGQPGTYAVQWATNLNNPVWRNRGNVTLTNNLFGTIRPANNPPTNFPGFFRVRQ
jgi:hypothetical protein